MDKSSKASSVLKGCRVTLSIRNAQGKPCNTTCGGELAITIVIPVRQATRPPSYGIVAGDGDVSDAE
jgi:hypothetical protein